MKIEERYGILSTVMCRADRWGRRRDRKADQLGSVEEGLYISTTQWVSRVSLDRMLTAS